MDGPLRPSLAFTFPLTCLWLCGSCVCYQNRRENTTMKKLILLTICTILLLTGCGQAAAPEVDTVPAIVQEETIPTTDTQDVPTGIAEVAVEPTISEIPAQSQHAPVVAPLEEPAITVPAEPPTADTPTQTPEPAPNTGLDTVPGADGRGSALCASRPPVAFTPSRRLCVWATSTPRHSTA